METNLQMNKRDYWLFQYQAGNVAEGAARQRDFRKSRQEWWKAKKEEVMNTIRAEGVEITESVADQLSNMSPSYGTHTIDPQVRIRRDLVQQLTECHQKINSHRKAAEEYDGWVQVLSARDTQGRTLDLTQEDWLYFFGKM